MTLISNHIKDLKSHKHFILYCTNQPTATNHQRFRVNRYKTNFFFRQSRFAGYRGGFADFLLVLQGMMQRKIIVARTYSLQDTDLEEFKEVENIYINSQLLCFVGFQKRSNRLTKGPIHDSKCNSEKSILPFQTLLKCLSLIIKHRKHSEWKKFK